LPLGWGTLAATTRAHVLEAEARAGGDSGFRPHPHRRLLPDVRVTGRRRRDLGDLLGEDRVRMVVDMIEGIVSELR